MSFGFGIISTFWDKVAKFLLCSFPSFHLQHAAYLFWSSVSSDKQNPEMVAPHHGYSKISFLSFVEAIKFPMLLHPSELRLMAPHVPVSKVYVSLLL